MSLTDKHVRQAPPKDKIYFLSDDDGLSLKIEPTGLKTWCYRYTDPVTKKRARKSLGYYPEMQLKQARNERDHKKAFLHIHGIWEGDEVKAAMRNNVWKLRF